MDTFNIDAELVSTDIHLDSHHLHDESCYRALIAKDSRFDGVFFVGVKTTGIYCRPICSAKTPRASSCTFYTNAASAEAAGFRPCLRCRPELAPYALQQNLAYAVWQRITAGALNHGHSDGENDDQNNDSSEQGKVEQLAAQVGLSSRQLRRVLLAHFGVTPIELAQTQRLLFAKKLLQETTLPMTVLAYAAGFGSVRRFNTLFNARYGMPPTALRRSLNTLKKSGTNTASTLSMAQMIDAKNDASNDITLRLAYRPPFSWDRMLAYLQPRLIAGVEMVDSAAQPSYYRRGVRMNGVTGWLTVTHLAKKNQLEIRIAASLTSVLMPLIARLRSQFDLDANPAFIAQHLRQDAALA
ncbi:MAG: helix-turn-helix domain-containing protein [Glaciimonas sp.]|nr:helix-turn-helix domain-containing protein [Glaciimonas sp.]